MDHYHDVLIIGAGMSGIGFAIQLIRQYGTRNFQLVEKSGHIGGTWHMNSYPGCGCDVPSHFYSYSFALNPYWPRKFAFNVRLETAVEAATWNTTSGTWSISLRDLKTSETFECCCKILVSAVGALSVPKEFDVPGASTFQGKMFHTAKWDHSFNWTNKEVIVIGNGCSATQAVPVMSDGRGAAKKITQFGRQAHWLAERPNPKYSALFKWTMKWVPLAMRLYRAKLYWEKEKDFRGFDVETGAETRREWSKEAADYIRGKFSGQVS
ncbi:pyridine nucleotide-disulfide oxidoreductase [Hirsutella rhossiliensis]|uniref:Pyridine nucleotide-disulfide oxidoreductase domain-containing protein n=1 Tax=Hirsutella rhossiliensis TaxID=111463 RepID=A0A9P8SK60_9HYPO|nr:pyridine nucleotide-disulfide oxidoreductase domain-containing protein [Hirsutella rhossiliensis]KAH0963786.1 pyridine nucleotide-disulfide oxidoreductase domain-containing protein [Hirsutella rhossiliensis]